MKHNLKITIILLSMFIVTQFIGLYVIDHYSQEENVIPFGMDSPKIEKETDFYTSFLPSIVVAFIIAIVLLILLTKFKMAFILRFWFFAVIMIALGIFFNSVLPKEKFVPLLALLFALPLAIIKVYKQNFLVHNLTELFIYPGIAVIFVPILNVWTIVFLLLLISVYDMWAVWRSGIMQKMAKYQIKELKIFSGFFIPYLSRAQRAKVKKMKKSELKNKKIKANVAILGGGDVIFPLITAGVMFVTYGLLSAILVIIGATLGLSYLFFFAKKKKFYPAMPYISMGIFLGMLVGWLIRVL